MGATLVSEEWTEARIEQLKSLWADGLSCTQIATAMGGTTRNAVIGKVHRLKLSQRRLARRSGPLKQRPPLTPRPPKARVRPAPKPSEKPRQIKPVTAHEPFEFSVSAWQPLSGSAPVTLEHMTGCKWPVGEAPNIVSASSLFCNCSPVEGKPYCLEHAERARGKGTVMEQKAVKEARTTARRERYVPEAFAA